MSYFNKVCNHHAEDKHSVNSHSRNLSRSSISYHNSRANIQILVQYLLFYEYLVGTALGQLFPALLGKLLNNHIPECTDLVPSSNPPPYSQLLLFIYFINVLPKPIQIRSGESPFFQILKFQIWAYPRDQEYT